MLARLGNAVKAPLLKCGRLYNATAVKSPMCTGLVTTVVKTSLADMFAQKVMESREEMDWRRHAMFCSFGLVYLGCFQYYLYNTLFVRWCSGITAAVGHRGSAPIKTFIDQAIHHPFVYFPSFYMLKGTVEGRTLDSSLTKYKADLWENCKALWLIWVPAQLVNFSFVPRHLRIPFVAGVSFAWTVVISCMRGTLESTTNSNSHAATAGEASHTAAAAAAAAPLLRNGSSRLGHGRRHDPSYSRKSEAPGAHDDSSRVVLVRGLQQVAENGESSYALSSWQAETDRRWSFVTAPPHPPAASRSNSATPPLGACGIRHSMNVASAASSISAHLTSLHRHHGPAPQSHTYISASGTARSRNSRV
ncbi:MAG: hypothetical protein WDW38_000772 [Sanguina aurantia]